MEAACGHIELVGKAKCDAFNFPQEESVQRAWTFRVNVKNLIESETVCITGDCRELGNWAYDQVVPLEKNADDNVWMKTINIPANKTLKFRYCICILSEKNKEIFVREWETHMVPRIICKSSIFDDKVDQFGEICGEIKVDNGWVSSGRIIKFNFYNNPFIMNNIEYNTNLSVKCTPFYSENDQCETHNMESVHNITPIKEAITEVATLNKTSSLLKLQGNYGEYYNLNDFLIFNITIGSISTKIAFVIDFYNHNHSQDTQPKHIGYSYIMASELNKTEGDLKIPIMCSNKNHPMGVMLGEFSIIRPLAGIKFTLERSYISYWKNTWLGLDIGHRGLGASFKEDQNIVRENTIASFKMAGTYGADMVEFDVQLSKDLIPIIYHDFHVCIALRKKKKYCGSELLEIPVKDLTYDQLQQLKLYHVGETEENERFHDEDLEEHQPFPLLADVMQKLDPCIGFNVEIKWPMKNEFGILQLENSFDMNIYIDKILEVILPCAGSRIIVFSCFHPEVCTMLRFKQNIYPVMFLTQGVTKKWPRAHDSRCNTIQAAVYNAVNSSLLGIVVHTEDLLRDPTQVLLAKDAGLIIFCWGEDNNNKDVIKSLKQQGLHGVIFDRMDLYSAKEVKESIFLTEDRKAKQLLRQQNTIMKAGEKY